MSDIVIEQTTRPWERMNGEPNLWFMRFFDFLMLGPRRTIAETMRKNLCKTSGSANWSAKAIQWDWHNRAEAYDEWQAEREEDMKWEILHSGLAMEHHRVQALKQMAEGQLELVLELQEHLKRDQEAGVFSEPLTKRFNAIVQAVQKTLGDIAAEKGDRVKKINVVKTLTDYAVELAMSEGYDIESAKRIAKMVGDGAVKE